MGEGEGVEAREGVGEEREGKREREGGGEGGRGREREGGREGIWRRGPPPYLDLMREAISMQSEASIGGARLPTLTTS